MTRYLRDIAVVTGSVCALGLAIFAASLYGFNIRAFFAPKYENLRRNVFENSQSYNDGMAQQLNSYYLEYQKTDEAGRQTLRSVISHQYANYPANRLPAHLQSFLISIKPSNF